MNVNELPTLAADMTKQGFTVIPSDPHEQLGTNVAVVRPGVVVAAQENVHTNANLRSAGIEVVEVPMSEILKKGGGPNCIMCDTNRDKVL